MTARKAPCITPAGAVARGAAAGLAGTAVITLLVRIAYAWKPRQGPQKSKLPADAFDPRTVQKWQDRSRAPAAYDNQDAGGGPPDSAKVEEAASVTPAGALAETQGPGPEGAAELFYLKAGSGLFDRDLAHSSKVAGKIVHVLYGVLWGVIYGIAQRRRLRDPWIDGPLYGVALWAAGPACVMPAMHLMPPLRNVPAGETALLIGGHAVYGTAVALLFDRELRRTR